MRPLSDNSKKASVNQDHLKKWQEIVDSISEVLEVSFVGILQIENPFLQVHSCNDSKGDLIQKNNIFEKHTHYCSTTINSQQKVLIPNALLDPKLANNPDAARGFIAYLGYPVYWPNKKIFGTVCVLDKKENAFGMLAEKLLLLCKEIVESHLLIAQNQEEYEEFSSKNWVLEEKLLISNSLLKYQKDVLEMLTSGQPLSEIFSFLTSGAEKFVANSMASILLLDDSGTRLIDGSTSSFSEVVREAFNGMKIGPLAGSCGTAAYSKQMVIAENIETDPRWADFLGLAKAENLKSCYSAPIISSKGNVLGTFALTFTQTSHLNEFEIGILQSCSYIAGLAIELKQFEEKSFK